ncbi:MAG: BatD family protein [Bacteroidia bacterium]|nr:BatD family protein [Bacteroidia bacterium]
MKLIKHILFITFLVSSLTQAQVKFEVKVSKNKLGINERLRVDFEMNKDGDNFNPPDFANFTVVGGPNQSVSNSWVNGKRSYSKTYSYFLSPKKRGAFILNQATIVIDGQTYKTSPVRITVTAAVDKPKDPNDPNYIADANIHLVAEVSNSKPYLNQAITVVYKLYVSPNTGVSNWREVDNPRFNDFWSQNIDIKGLKVENGTYKGEDYRYVVLRRTVLYPQKIGKLNIEPLSLDITVDVPTNRRDIFGGRLMKQVHKRVSAGNRSINVKPLPETGKPIDFTGAVGDFDFRVTTSKTELNATESLQAKVEVFGRGNLKLFELPKITVPSSLEVYEPEKSDKIRTTIRGMQGERAESYTIVPQFKGKYPIPSISFSYFDTRTESYRRLFSKEIIIDVLEGPSNNITTSQSPSGINKLQVLSANNQFAYIKTKTRFIPKRSEYFFRSKLFWSSLLLPLLAIPLAIIIRRKKAIRDADFVGNRKRKADKLAKKYLSEAKKSLGKKEAFYVALEKALHNYLKAKLSIETSDFSKEKITELLDDRKVEESVTSEFLMILKSCELARYTPFTNVEMKLDYNKAAKTISIVDKQIR